MFNFNVDWATFVRIMIPIHKRKSVRVAWLDVLISQVSRQHGIFYVWKDAVLFRVMHNTQKIYLTKLLNDIFDPAGRGIYIENVQQIDRFYLYNKLELKPPKILYGKWDNTRAYVIGDKVNYLNQSWKAVAASTGEAPGSGASWIAWNSRIYLKSKQEYFGTNDFIVWVPAALTVDPLQISAWVNRYLLAGKRYTIQTY